MRTRNTLPVKENWKDIPIIPPDLMLWLTLMSLNYLNIFLWFQRCLSHWSSPIVWCLCLNFVWSFSSVNISDSFSLWLLMHSYIWFIGPSLRMQQNHHWIMCPCPICSGWFWFVVPSSLRFQCFYFHFFMLSLRLGSWYLSYNMYL